MHWKMAFKMIISAHMTKNIDEQHSSCSLFSVTLQAQRKNKAPMIHTPAPTAMAQTCRVPRTVECTRQGVYQGSSSSLLLSSLELSDTKVYEP